MHTSIICLDKSRPALVPIIITRDISYSQYSIYKIVNFMHGEMEKLKKRQVLNQLDSLINNIQSLSEGNNIWQQDILALEIAKKAVNKEYRYRFLASVILSIATVIVFGSLVLMSYFIYRQ